MVGAQLLEAAVVVSLLAHEHRAHRRLHVVVDAAPADPAEEAERALVRLEHHLLALARKDLDQLHAAVTQPHVRRLYPGRRASDNTAYSWLQLLLVAEHVGIDRATLCCRPEDGERLLELALEDQGPRLGETGGSRWRRIVPGAPGRRSEQETGDDREGSAKGNALHVVT